MRYVDFKSVVNEMSALAGSSEQNIPLYIDNINSILASDDREFKVGPKEPKIWKFTADADQTVDSLDSEIKGKGIDLKGKEVNTVQVKKLFKGEAIKGGVTVNMGDAAEAILGSAITAKFEMGGGSIGENQLIKILVEASNKGS